MINLEDALEEIRENIVFKHAKCLTEGEVAIFLAELMRYEDLEEQGRLIELPCKVGDRVWEIHHRAWEGYADDWLYPDYTRSIVQECGFSLSLLSSIGSTVFLTKAEAEAKLAELKGETE